MQFEIVTIFFYSNCVGVCLPSKQDLSQPITNTVGLLLVGQRGTCNHVCNASFSCTQQYP